MLAAASADWRTTGGQLEEPPPYAADLQSCGHTGPRLSTASGQRLQKRGRRGSARDRVAEDNRASAGDELEAVPGDPLIGTG